MTYLIREDIKALEWPSLGAWLWKWFSSNDDRDVILTVLLSAGQCVDEVEDLFIVRDMTRSR